MNVIEKNHLYNIIFLCTLLGRRVKKLRKGHHFGDRFYDTIQSDSPAYELFMYKMLLWAKDSKSFLLRYIFMGKWNEKVISFQNLGR